MTSDKRALFRADAGPTIGAGHAVRCLALAEMLCGEGWRCAFAANAGFEAALPFAPPAGVEIAEREGDGSWDPAALAAKWPDSFDLAVVDHYDLDAVYERELDRVAAKVLVIDDLLNRPHDCDLLVSPAPPASVLPEETGARRPLLGPDAALLRQQFVQARDEKLLEEGEPGSPLRVHIGLGGTSQRALVGRIIDGLALLGVPLSVTVLGDLPEVDGLAPHIEINSIPATGDAASLLAGCDIAIGACGGSAFERAVLGLPSIALVLANNQKHVAQMLQDAGAANVVTQGGEATAAEICEAARPLIDDASLRAAMAGRTWLLCDGLGAARAMLAVDPETDRLGRSVELNRARAQDCETLLNWQRHPETRRYANNPDIPSWEEHQAWFAGRLQDRRCLLLIISCDGISAGVLRLDFMRWEDRLSRLVSIAVAPDQKKQGIGLAALKAAKRMLPNGTFVADVHPDNAASCLLFERAGYQRQDARTYLLGDQSVAVVVGGAKAL